MARARPHPNAEPIAGYKLRRYLGRGGFGEVWEAEAPGGLSKAVKIAPVESDAEGISCRELEGLTKIRDVRHPYLLSIERFEVIDGYLIIVMELADRSLADRFNECVADGLPGIPRAELLHYLREAAEVLDLLNERHGLQHLDIKPENLFLCGDHVKVADFGLVQPRNTNINRSAIAISPPYAPPELFDGRIEQTADQYSLAVTYQELLSGTRPYVGTDVRSLMLQHLRGRPDLSALPPSDRPILSRAIYREAASRYPNCSELIEALVHAPHHEALTSGERTPSLTPTPTRSSRSTSPLDPLPPARTHRVRARMIKETEKCGFDTISMRDETFSVPSELPNAAIFAGENVHSTFVAFLPVEIYAHKLRGFVDAMNADLWACTTQRTVLYMGGRGWFGRPTGKGMVMMIETYTRNPHAGFRIVDVRVWSTGRELRSSDLGRRGMLLIRCLKYYLMAADEHDLSSFYSDAEVRAAILT